MVFKTKSLVFIAAVLATGLYLLYLPRVPVGRFNDDASYISLARSLAQGRYANPAFLGAPPETSFPPGYPLFLTPFVELVGSHIEWLRFTSIALTLLSVGFLWGLIRGCSSLLIRNCVVGLFALNPVLAGLSGSVMSERLFICLILAVFWIMDRASRDASKKWIALLAVALSWAVLTRSTAVSLFVAVAGAVVAYKPARSLIPAVATAAFVAGLWAARNYGVSQTSSSYLGYLQAEIPYFLSRPTALLDNVMRVAYLFFVYTFTGISLPHTGWAMGLCGVWTAVLIYWAIRGVKRLDASAAWRAAALLFTVCLFGIHAIWVSIDARFVLPLLPLFLMMVFEGIGSRKGVMLFAVLLTGSYLYRHAATLTSKVSEFVIPYTTFHWMQQNLPQGSHVLYPAISTLWLYTGFDGAAGYEADNQEAFRDKLLQNRIGYAVFAPLAVSTLHGAAGSHDSKRVIDTDFDWISQWPKAFKPIYSNPEERTIVFAVQPK